MLTKIFIVLLSLFSIAFTSITVAVVAQTANWKDTAEKYKEHAKIADTNLRHEIAANAALLATARDESRELHRRIGDVEGQLQSTRAETAQLRSELAKGASEKSSAEAINRGLLAQLQVADRARAEYRRQRDQLETRNIDLERRSVDLNDRVNELTSQVMVLVEQKRQYEQQINILRRTNEKLSMGAGVAPLGFERPEGAAMTGVRPMTPVAASAIRGRILEVSGDLVMVSVGSADGVKRDMLFVIHRDGEYVGDLEITVVDPNQSAGRVVRSTTSPSVDDRVTDAVFLARSRG